MQAPRPRSPLSPALTFAALLLTSAAAAQELTPPPASSPEAGVFRLHQAFKPCGKKWLKRAAKLTPEQMGWMMRQEHRRYTLSAAGETVMTVELLSTASFRDCDVARHWATRETTIRITFFSVDGSRRTQLVNYSTDDVFFDREPRFFASQGRALLRGVRQDGTLVSRWLELEGLPALVAEHRQAEGTRLAELGPAEPGERPTVVAATGAGGF